jgi:hypothetical protein
MATPESRRPPPPLPDHLLELILARLPPEDPSCLLRASLVCKHWRDLIYDPKFLPHLLELGRAPQMLGFLYHSESQGRREYVPTSPFSFPLPDFSGWDLHGYRHGRAVFQSTRRIEDHNFPQDISLLVWVPFTGQRTEVPAPFKLVSSYATVICAADGCDHRNCHGGPFFIVLVSGDPEHENEEMQSFSSACVYSSKTGAWGEVVSTNGVCFVCNAPAVLVGKSLLYFLSNCGYIVEYDLARHSLVRIKAPYHRLESAWNKKMILVQAEDAGLGIALVKPDPDTLGFSDDGCDCLCLLSRKVSEGGDAKWVKLGVIYLEDLFSHVRASTIPNRDITAYLIGFAEGANTVFVSTYEHDDIFAVELQSKWARKVYQCDWRIDCLAPVLSSYTTGPALLAPQREHHNLMAPVLSSSDEENDEEGGWEQDAQLRFDKGLKAIEERRFVAAVDHLRYALDLRLGVHSQTPFRPTPRHTQACRRMYCGKEYPIS